ncbi:polysaccharide deacetylase [Massilia sp. RP-1-19]|uniref:Polysaccharide deacetylase n=1 Tax=Massilia polaris TaxID=2728846 RepID=A0A848HJL0_9BURK|nr:polysaccharide deacetylase [Massilia polaris]NML60319.1 polysaccharide deacetylase [Massilia polaris]
MVNVFITVDVELWCDGWTDIDRRFAQAMRKYIYGDTAQGGFGIPYQLNVLNEHGLDAVFFVEPLFSARFGPQPLADIVGLIQSAGQEVQLHLHTEWVDEARTPLLPDVTSKRQHLRYYTLAEQTSLIAQGAGMLERAGARRPDAFRAGSFGFNRDTIGALAANGIPFDSSYNATLFGPDSGVLPGELATAPFACGGVHEYPMTVFMDGTRKLRHVQLTACSHGEIEGLLLQAAERGDTDFVILSHGFELLNKRKDRADKVVLKRFHQLCKFLDRRRDAFTTRGFTGLAAAAAQPQPPLLSSSLWQTGTRIAEQALRRRYR